MTCESCKTECCHLPRRNCYLCGANIGLHDKWFFDESAGGKPRHRHCDNPGSYFSTAEMVARVFNRVDAHQVAMEDLVGHH